MLLNKFILATNFSLFLYHSVCAALGDYDASSSPYTVTFVPGQMTANITVDTIGDSTVQLTEQFKAILAIPAASSSIGVRRGSADTALVDILDNDGCESICIQLLCFTQYNLIL